MKKLNKLFVLAASLVIALLLVGCEKNKTEEKKEYVLPTISNPDEVIYEKTIEGKGTIKVTKDEAYAFVRYSGGVTLLLQQLDDKLLDSYIKQISTDDEFYLSRYNHMVYDTTEASEIDEIKNNKEENDKALSSFNSTLEVMGYNTQEKVENYIKTLAARDKFAYDYLTKHAKDKYSSYMIQDETLADYYLDNKYTTCQAIIISYTNVSDYEYALEQVGLALCGGMLVDSAKLAKAKQDAGITSLSHIGDQIEVVTGEDGVSKVVFYDKEGAEVATLENAATLENFVKLYNKSYYNQYPQIDKNAVPTYDYEALCKGSTTLANKVFALKNGEYTYNVSSDTTGIGTQYSLIYKVSGEVEDEYDKLDDTTKATILEKYIKEYVQTSSNVTAIMSEYRNDHGIKFYDNELAYEYNQSFDSSYEYLTVESDGNKIVSIKDDNKNEIVITADDYCDYALSISKDYYAMSAAIVELEQYLPSYSIVYGDEKDIELNASERKSSFIESINSYVEENYKEETFGTKEVYLFNLVGFDNMDDIVKYYYCANDLKSFAVLDTLYTKDDEGTLILNPESDYTTKFQEAIDDYLNNYYSIYAYDLKVVIDTNHDYIVNDTLTSYEGVLAEVRTFLNNKMADKLKELKKDDPDKTNLTTSEIETVVKEMIEDYNETSKFYSGADADLTAYANWKQQGLILSYSQINSGSVISYSSNGSSYTKIKNTNYKRIYDKMVADSITSSTESYLDEAFFLDEDGAHLTFAKFGTKVSTFKYTSETCENKSLNKLAINEDGGSITLAQAYGSFYNYLYDSIFTDAETAEEEYGITEYPVDFPDEIDLSAINSVLSTYFLTDTFVNKHFANDLSKEAGDYYSRASEIYALFLDLED